MTHRLAFEELVVFYKEILTYGEESEARGDGYLHIILNITHNKSQIDTDSSALFYEQQAKNSKIRGTTGWDRIRIYGESGFTLHVPSATFSSPACREYKLRCCACVQKRCNKGLYSFYNTSTMSFRLPLISLGRFGLGLFRGWWLFLTLTLRLLIVLLHFLLY